jgi:hypothetical protein
MSYIEVSHILFREVGRAASAGMKKAIAVWKANLTIASALERHSCVGCEALTFRESSLFPVCGKETKHFSGSDGLSKSPPTAAICSGIV